MGRRKCGRDIDGVVLLDKPSGLSSNQALQRVRRALDAKKAGHTGSLDPLATGLLPICLGEATKISSYLLGADKQYHVIARVGQETTTGDREGEVTRTSDQPMPSRQRFVEILDAFNGPQEQVPPMYSALKVDGKPLYQYAREGRVIERRARAITVHAVDLVALGDDWFELDLSVSSGTYVRTLVEDIARAWGGCAHVSQLRRTRVGVLGEREPMISLDDFEDALEFDPADAAKWLHPISDLISDWPGMVADEDQRARLTQGQSLINGAWVRHDRPYRLYGVDGALFGLGVCETDGELRPKRIFSRPQG